MSSNEDTVLLTGATGFVGMELLARYLERTERPIAMLVRARDDDAARERASTVVRNLFGNRSRPPRRYMKRIDAIAGDTTADGFGVSRSRRERLAERVETIVHCAATVSFTLPLSESRETNVQGTRNVLEFAKLAQRRGGLRRLGHVSTAYVAGTHAGRFCEGDLDCGQDFRNSYEQSKFEAEQLVRSQDTVPFTIMRPSIVVGDRRSGWTSAFNVLYWPLRAFSRGLFTTVPAVRSAPVDVVSVDYVADAVQALAGSAGAAGETYHLTAGANASTIGEIAELASEYFRRPVPRVLDPEEYARNGGQSVGGEYFPYFSVASVFDEAATRRRLEPLGITVSPLADYLGRLLDFATRSRWGKRPIARVEALAS
jgi:thioester reductase-like protein